MAKYRAVIFDFGDTLVESRELKWAQHKVVAKKFYDIDLTDDDIKEHWGKPFNVLISKLYRDSDTLENMQKSIYSVKNDFLKNAYDGTVEVVKKLLSQGMQVGIVSAANKSSLIEDLPRLKFPVDDFFIMQGSDEVSFHKPDPQVFNVAFKLLEEKGISKEHIVYIGDSLSDLEASHNAGIDFIAVTTGLYSADDFQKNAAQVIVNKIKDVLEYI